MFVLLETGINALLSRYKLFHFNLVKLKITQKQPTAYCSAFCWTKSYRRSFNVFWKKSFTFSWVFIKNLSSD